MAARCGMAAFDAGAFAGWSIAAAALMAATALSYRMYCGARRRDAAGMRGGAGNGGARIEGGPGEAAGGGPGGPAGRGAAAAG